MEDQKSTARNDFAIGCQNFLDETIEILDASSTIDIE